MRRPCLDAPARSALLRLLLLVGASVAGTPACTTLSGTSPASAPGADAQDGGRTAPPWRQDAQPARGGAQAADIATSDTVFEPTDGPVEATEAPAPLARPFEWALEDGAAGAVLAQTDARNRGAGAADFDGDGDVDLWLSNLGDGSSLLLNDGSGIFVEQTVPHTIWGTAVAIADYDGDGDPDVFEACGGFSSTCPNGLYRNDGVDPGGVVQFTDVSASSGIGEAVRANFGGAWQDYDLDGDLDLFVATKDPLGEPAKFIGVLWNQHPGAPPMDSSTTSADLLYRNHGDGTFEEVAEAAGLGDTGDGHQGAWLDYDGDGLPDLFVPVYLGLNHLYQNQGDGSFQDVTPAALALPWAAFGALAEDFDQDGHVDLLVAARHNLQEQSFLGIGPEPHGLYLSDGSGGFLSRAIPSGLADPESLAGYGGVMGLQVGDLDLDGGLEVFFGNGAPWPNGDEPNLLLSALPGHWTPGGSGELAWADRSEHIQFPPPGSASSSPPRPDDGDPPREQEEAGVYPYRSHGAVFFDCDSDADLDLFVGNGGIYPTQREPNRLFLGAGAGASFWVGLDLEGRAPNLDAIGSVIRCRRWRNRAGPPRRATEG